MTDRGKARDLGNQSAALARSIADVLNDTLDALETAEKERDRWRVVACNVKDGTAAAAAEVHRLNHENGKLAQAQQERDEANAHREDMQEILDQSIKRTLAAEAERDRWIREALDRQARVKELEANWDSIANDRIRVQAENARLRRNWTDPAFCRPPMQEKSLDLARSVLAVLAAPSATGGDS